MLIDRGDISDIPLRNVEPGQKILPPFDTPVGRVGLAICFDVRVST